MMMVTQKVQIKLVVDESRSLQREGLGVTHSRRRRCSSGPSCRLNLSALALARPGVRQPAAQSTAAPNHWQQCESQLIDWEMCLQNQVHSG